MIVTWGFTCGDDGTIEASTSQMPSDPRKRPRSSTG